MVDEASLDPAAAAAPAAPALPVRVKVALTATYANLDLTLPAGGRVDPRDPVWASLIDRGIVEIVG